MDEAIIQVNQQLSQMAQIDYPLLHLSAEEKPLKEFLWHTYKELKHREHVLAVFLAIRRRRMLARLQIAHQALQMAQSLLEPDQQLLVDLQLAVDRQRQAETFMQMHRKPKQEAVRIKGLSDSEVRAQLNQLEEQAREAGQNIDHRHIYGDTISVHRQIAAFEQQLHQVRDLVDQGIGWFEEYYISRVQLTREARKYLVLGEDVPEHVLKYEGLIYGPYLKYRWQEAGSPIYTLQMGRIPHDEINVFEVRPEDLEPDQTPWPEI
jgi:hypothetical protein